MRHYRFRCPVMTCCDLCLLRGKENPAVVRRAHVVKRSHLRLLRSATSPHVRDIPGSTYDDVCRYHDRHYITFEA